MEEEPTTTTSQVCTVGSNNVKVCSLFNAKDYSGIINQDNIKISKLMKLNISNNQPIILQDYAGYVRDYVGGNLSRASVDLVPSGPLLENQTMDIPKSSLNSPILLSSTSMISNIPDIKFCSFCNTGFRNQIEQRQHYKLDWHRYNIKLNIKQKQSVSEQKFSEMMTKSNDIDNDDVSSISGSESDDSSDSDTESSSVKLPISQKLTTSDNATTISSSNKTRVIFENNKGNIIALYKCLFIPGDKADESEFLTEAQYINIFNRMPKTIPNTKSLVVMLGGGHFAAAVFKGSEPVLHKTFHSYTVRAKQGGSQSTKDNKRATGAKSAGASLRRYNEQSLLQHVQDILSTWSNEIAECKYIFYRAVGPANRSILFGGKQSPLDKNDSRLCKIPFPTRRATFSEVKRVHSLLMSLYIYESEEIFSNIFQLNSNFKKPSDRLLSSPAKKKIAKDDGNNSNKTNRASKLRQSPTRDDDDKEITDIVDRLKLESSSSSDCENNVKNKDAYTNSVNDVSISFGESLLEYDNTPVPKSKKQQRSKNKKLNSTAIKDKDNLNGCDKEHIKENVEENADGDSTNEDKLKKKNRKKKSDKLQNISEGNKDPVVNKLSKKIYLSCFNRDIDSLKIALDDYRNLRKGSELSAEINDETMCYDAIVHVFNQTTQDGLTLLQNAAKNSQKEIVRFLLENGGDPCAKDKKSMTAYDFAPDKDTRNVFRRFMGEFPDKYDYSKSHIPSPLTDSIEKESAEKKRALKKAKRQKEKEKRIADEPRRQEEAEKKRFLQLSDREKRALAAERRILASVGKAADNLALTRCYQCAINITGKVPFEYDSKLFCSMDCLKAHRVMAKKNQL